MVDGGWWMEDGRWKMEDGRWKMEDGRWKMEDGRWKMEEGVLQAFWVISKPIKFSLSRFAAWLANVVTL
jgi:hypothetical protein